MGGEAVEGADEDAGGDADTGEGGAQVHAAEATRRSPNATRPYVCACYCMCMLTRRLQVLLDEERATRLEAEARRRGVAVAVLVREAIDRVFPTTTQSRRDAAAAILDADPMPVPPVDYLRRELAESRDRLA